MSFRKVALISALMAALISGCGIAARPQAGTPHLLTHPGFHGVYDDQRPTRTACLKLHHIPYVTYLTKHRINGTPTDLQAVKVLKGGATVIFYPDAGIAEGQVIMGQALGSELIGSALLYPENTSGATLTTVENCVATGVG